MILLCLMSMMLISVAGCGFKKEIVLEHSSQEHEEESLDDASDGLEGDSAKLQAETIQDTVGDEQIFVYICGQVACPGVYELPVDARVFAAIELAGGLTAEADPAGVNQAQTLTDGQMLYIPAVGESSSIGNGTSLTDDGESGGSKVNINTADLEALMSLPGIGQGKAQSILDYRQEHGSFQSIEEIMEVDGIKEGTYTKFKDKITI